MDKAGYLSFGPFRVAKDLKTTDIEETLGKIPVLWVETAHFKLGSTLKTYKFQGDQKENERLKDELGRLKSRFDKFTPPRGKLDPWLRLHLFALRLEDLYADFQQRFALQDAGPLLGMELKYTVLLLEKESGLVRFSRRYLSQEPKTFVRWQLPEARCSCASRRRACATTAILLESAYECFVTGELVHSLVDGYRQLVDGRAVLVPLRPRALLHAPDRRGAGPSPRSARRASSATTRGSGSPRIARLVANGFVKPWEDMFAWQKWDDLKARATCWPGRA
jgi:hypothetical protein